MQALLQQVRPPAQELGSISGAGGADIEALRHETETWTRTLGRAQVHASEISTSPSLAPVHELFERSIGLYLSSAKTFGLAADAEGALRVSVLARAGEQRDAAMGVWAAAIQLLERERARAELVASGLGVPAPPVGAGANLPGSPGDGGGGGG